MLPRERIKFCHPFFRITIFFVKCPINEPYHYCYTAHKVQEMRAQAVMDVHWLIYIDELYYISRINGLMTAHFVTRVLDHSIYCL
jgi:hypothetical protein